MNMATSQADMYCAYHMKAGEKSRLSAALLGGFGQRAISMTQAQWGSQFDGSVYNPALPGGDYGAQPSFNYIDIGGGLAWHYRKNEGYMTGNDQREFSAGFSFCHPQRYNYSFFGEGDKIYPRFLLHGSALLGISNSTLSVLPGFIVQLQGAQLNVLAGSYFRFQLGDVSKYTGIKRGAALFLGAHYRAGDAIVFSLTGEHNEYAAGCSYDITVSKLTAASRGNGAIELFFRYTLHKQKAAETDKSRI